MTSLGGYLCYVIFLDDFSRKTWIYFLKKKDEVFKWFRSFKALVKNQIGKKIKILRTDNETKYESNDYCREAGIKWETTTTYTPKKNGVSKSKNHTIIEVAHAILHDQGLLKFLWGEAIGTTMYVQSRCLHQALDFKKLEEVFTSLMDPIGPPPNEPTIIKIPLCLKHNLEDVEKHVAPRGAFRQRKKWNRYQGYLVAMSTIVQSKPCTFEKAVKHQVWKDVMDEEYESIMNNYF
eukprot:PITA_15205